MSSRLTAYWFLPNTRVRFLAALIGGMAGGFLWAGSGFLFATFVATSARALSIYATFAIVILALIWLYLCWLTLLIGALVSFYVQNPEHLRVGYRPVSIGSRQRELIAFSVMIESARAFREGGRQPSMSDLSSRLKLPELLISPVINRLVAAELLSRSGRDKIFPQRDPDSINLRQIMDAVREPQSTDVFPEGRWPELASAVSGRVDKALDQALAEQSLYELLDSDASTHSDSAAGD